MTPTVTELAGRLRAAGCVFAEDEARLLLEAAADPEDLARLAAARVAGEPLEYLLGWAEFRGLRIAVAPGVFVPRRRSEFLVELATDGAPDEATVVDLCCGTGAIGIALAREIGAGELHLVELDPAAADCARRNLTSFVGDPQRAAVYVGDLFAPLPARLRGRVDLLVANAPYVPTEALVFMPAESRLHEPPLAVDGGADGLDLLRRVIAEAPRWLAEGGRLLVETSSPQAERTSAAMRAAGLHASLARDDGRDATVATAARRA